jgi:hypothetical protein
MSEPTTRQGHTRWVTSGKPIPTDQNYHMSFDPGETTGWASFDQSGKLTGSGVITGGLTGLSDFLCGIRTPPKRIIAETYRIKDFQHHHNMSTVPTIRLLGVLEQYAYMTGATWHEQESTAYGTGIKWANIPGLTVKKGHQPDDESAIGHGVYWLHKNGLWEIVL